VDITISVSDAAAWWGAIVATSVLAWDIYKWRKHHADIQVSTAPNMQTINPISHRLDDEKNIFVEVVNNGEKTTTLTHLVALYYKNRFALLRRKPTTQGIIPVPGGSPGLPFELAPGHRWTGLIDQEDLISKSGPNGLFFCSIYHSASKKPVLSRVRFTK